MCHSKYCYLLLAFCSIDQSLLILLLFNNTFIILKGSDRPTLERIGNWRDVAVQLSSGIQLDELKIYKSGERADSEVCSEVFENWLQKNVESSWKKLLEAFEKADIHHLTDGIREKIFQGSSTCS